MWRHRHDNTSSAVPSTAAMPEVSEFASNNIGRKMTVKAASGKPVNFLNSGAFGFSVDDLAKMGVRRISVGGSLSRVAMHAFIKMAKEISEQGTFTSFDGLITNAELNKFFSEDRKKRQ